MALTDADIRYEDDALLVISKPAGLVVHPGAGNRDGTLLDQLPELRPELAGVERMGLVHRLDKDTSGLLVIAKTDQAKTKLSRAFANRRVAKRYTAVVHGTPAPPTGVINAPITRHHADRQKMTVRPDGKAATTEYAVLRSAGNRSLLDVWIGSGRTHQIRVHLAALGTPVVGDATYGQPEAELGRQFLHAIELEFPHPETGQGVRVVDELPQHLRQYLGNHGLS